MQTPNRNFTARAVRHGLTVTVFMDGAHGFALTDPLAAAADLGAGGDVVTAPMPGLVKTVTAEAGDEVEAGDPLATMEAMKMEHTLKAPRSGSSPRCPPRRAIRWRRAHPRHIGARRCLM